MLVERRRDVQEAAVLLEQVWKCSVVSWANSGSRIVSTLLPTIAASIIAVVLIPTTAALCDDRVEEVVDRAAP